MTSDERCRQFVELYNPSAQAIAVAHPHRVFGLNANLPTLYEVNSQYGTELMRDFLKAQLLHHVDQSAMQVPSDSQLEGAVSTLSHEAMHMNIGEILHFFGLLNAGMLREINRSFSVAELMYAYREWKLQRGRKIIAYSKQREEEQERIKSDIKGQAYERIKKSLSEGDDFPWEQWEREWREEYLALSHEYKPRVGLLR